MSDSKSINTEQQIAEIVSSLKTRLAYATVKIQNGWTSQSLDQIENNLRKKNTESRVQKSSTSPSSSHRRTNSNGNNHHHTSPNQSKKNKKKKVVSLTNHHQKLGSLNSNKRTSSQSQQLPQIQVPSAYPANAYYSIPDYGSQSTNTNTTSTDVSRPATPQDEFFAVQSLMDMSSPRGRQ